MLEDRIRGYAKTILQYGVKLEKGQKVFIEGTTQTLPLARLIAEEAYKMGAVTVETAFTDDTLNKFRAVYATEENLANQANAIIDYKLKVIDDGGVTIMLMASNPFEMNDVPPSKLLSYGKAFGTVRARTMARMQACEWRWTMVAYPGENWAKLLFPTSKDPVTDFWGVILDCAYVGKNGEVGWGSHLSSLLNYCNILNSHDIETLEFKASNGTSFKCNKLEGISWMCAELPQKGTGINFSGNIPTEEIAITPHKYSVNGRIVASKPLAYGGSIIENFYIDFENGKVTSYRAEKGNDILKSIIETDAGSCYLGEVALVPFSCQVNKTGLLFYSTLFDENAACHVALGSAYPFGEFGKMTPEQLETVGFNLSKTHVDYMFGTNDMECVAIKRNGEKYTIMKNGEFVF